MALDARSGFIAILWNTARGWRAATATACIAKSGCNKPSVCTKRCHRGTGGRDDRPAEPSRTRTTSFFLKEYIVWKQNGLTNTKGQNMLKKKTILFLVLIMMSLFGLTNDASGQKIESSSNVASDTYVGISPGNVYEYVTNQSFGYQGPSYFTKLTIDNMTQHHDTNSMWGHGIDYNSTDQLESYICYWEIGANDDEGMPKDQFVNKNIKNKTCNHIYSNPGVFVEYTNTTWDSSGVMISYTSLELWKSGAVRIMNITLIKSSSPPSISPVTTGLIVAGVLAAIIFAVPSSRNYIILKLKKLRKKPSKPATPKSLSSPDTHPKSRDTSPV